MTLPDDVIERMARALCESRTWPGAWIRANEAEINAWRHDAQAAFNELFRTHTITPRAPEPELKAR